MGVCEELDVEDATRSLYLSRSLSHSPAVRAKPMLPSRSRAESSNDARDGKRGLFGVFGTAADDAEGRFGEYAIAAEEGSRGGEWEWGWNVGDRGAGAEERSASSSR